MVAVHRVTLLLQRTAEAGAELGRQSSNCDVARFFTANSAKHQLARLAVNAFWRQTRPHNGGRRGGRRAAQRSCEHVQGDGEADCAGANDVQPAAEY